MYNVVYEKKYECKPITEAFAGWLEKALVSDPDVVYCDSDLMALIGVRDVCAKYHDRVLNSGIQEANMVGVGAGLSALGFKAYVHSFAAFVARRAFDQIFISAAYGGNSLHIIGSEPGIKQDYNGGTHMTFEDIALMRTIPNAYVFDVTDTAMLLSLLDQTKDMSGIFYYRVPMSQIYKVYSDESTFTAGKGNILRDGRDASVIACGCMVAPALEAADLLGKEGINVRVVDMFTVKPLDKPLVLDCAQKTKAIVTVENAAVSGGLGEAVSAFVTENFPVFMKHIAVNDEFGEVGPESYLFERYGFTADNIARQVKAAIALKG